MEAGGSSGPYTWRVRHPRAESAGRRSEARSAWFGASKAPRVATPNIGCDQHHRVHRGDSCLAKKARAIPIAERSARFDDPTTYSTWRARPNIPGCLNAAATNTSAHRSIGGDKNGEEWYQVVRGSQTRFPAPAALGRVVGPSFSAEEVPAAIERLIEVYLERRDSDAERFIDVVHRIGVAPFKERVYGNPGERRENRERQLAAA